MCWNIDTVEYFASVYMSSVYSLVELTLGQTNGIDYTGSVDGYRYGVYIILYTNLGFVDVMYRDIL